MASLIISWPQYFGFNTYPNSPTFVFELLLCSIIFSKEKSLNPIPPITLFSDFNSIAYSFLLAIKFLIISTLSDSLSCGFHPAFGPTNSDLAYSYKSLLSDNN